MLAIISVGSALLTVSARAEYCGGQDWHTGWLSDRQVTYQAYSNVNDFSVYGGKTEAASKLSSTSTGPLYDPSSETAAIVLSVTNNSKEPTNVLIMNTLAGDTGPTFQVSGIKALSAISSNKVFAVLDYVPNGATTTLVAHINLQDASVSVFSLEFTVLSNFQFATILGLPSRIWLLADIANSIFSGSTFLARFSVESSSPFAANAISVVNSVSNIKDHTL